MLDPSYTIPEIHSYFHATVTPDDVWATSLLHHRFSFRALLGIQRGLPSKVRGTRPRASELTVTGHCHGLDVPLKMMLELHLPVHRLMLFGVNGKSVSQGKDSSVLLHTGLMV